MPIRFATLNQVRIRVYINQRFDMRIIDIICTNKMRLQHNMNHLIENIEDIGPFFSFSMFPHERFYGIYCIFSIPGSDASIDCIKKY